MRKFLTIALTLGLLAGACSADDPTTQANDNGREEITIDLDGEQIVLTSSLSGFGDCDLLLDHLRTEGAERVGPYGFNNGWYGGGPVFAEADFALDDAVEVSQEGAFDGDASNSTAPAAAGGDAGRALAEGVDFSGTNVQEIGVDEADIVKTDGERIYIVANSQLVVVDVASRTVVGKVDVTTGDTTELFLAGDEILHITFGWFSDDVIQFAYPLAGDAEASFTDDIREPGNYGPRTMITRISVGGDAPEILESLAVEGDYVSSRAVNGVARIVLRSNPQYDFPFVYPAGPSGEDRATESNRDALLDSELSDWLPEYTSLDANGETTGSGLLPSCEQVHAPTEFAGFGVLSVLTVPVGGSIDPTATSSVLAPGNVVYSSPDALYIATTAWFDAVIWEDADWEEIQNNRQTSIHRFDLSSSSSAAYTSSGSVPGDIRDSFSMSEHEGYLRVVTTTGDPWSDTSETFVRVLEEDDGALVEIGSVGDMGRGEAVQSVRFQGDVGYVVTFEQVDPLYTLDLSEPTNPVVRGELKIPGFSSYLHPIGDGLVLGVGSDADVETGAVTGTKVSLFDVSDLDNPQEIAIWVGPNGWNNVGWDTHAFLWWAPENLAVVPMELWEDGTHWAGAVVLKVQDGTITEVGRIDHVDDEAATPGETECTKLGPEDLPTQNSGEFESEFEYWIIDDYSLVLSCGDGETRSATGFDCSAEQWMEDEAARIGFDIGDDTLVVCWPYGNQVPSITRTMVLPGGELWSISSTWGWLGGQSDARLQVNDLITLDRLDTVAL